MFITTRRIFQSKLTNFSFSRFSSFEAPAVGKNIKDSYNAPHSEALVFNNAKEVFGHRSTKELLRAYAVLNACAVETLVSRSYKLMKIGERILGPFLLSKFLSPFYFQFVAGDTEKELKNVVEILSSVGVNLIICPLLETDLGETEDRLKLFDQNFHKTLQMIEMSSRYRPNSDHLRPICLLKITAHINADILSNITPAYESLNPEERSFLVQAIADRMKKLRYSEDLPTELSFPGLNISEEDSKAMNDCLPKLVKMGELSKEKNVILAVDGEFTYTNSAISLLTLALMLTFNDSIPIVWNTYQGYLKSTKYWLKHDFELVHSLGYSFGAKIVRGAYMEREKEYAKMNNKPYPVNDSYELTSETYDSLINFLLPHVATSPSKFQMIAATHNEASILNAVQKMKLHGISNSSSAFVFGQTYGMAENISVPLSKGGYSVFKAVAYGHFIDVLPYLSRRAQENGIVFKGTRRERALLAQELWRRLRK